MSEAHWYVVHTYSGYENKVKVDIEKTIENRNLQDQILEVSVPMLPVVELKNGVEKKADKKMFPGYVLIHMVMNDDTWSVSYTHLDVYKRQGSRQCGNGRYIIVCKKKMLIGGPAKVLPPAG